MNDHIKTILLLLTLSFLLTGQGNCQDILTQQSEQQKQINELRRDVDELQGTVAILKKLLPRHALSPIEAQQSKASTKPAVNVEPLSSTEKEKIKAEVCADVGLFFDQVDKALKMSDDSAAEKAMNKAVARLHASLDRHIPDESLRKIMDLAEAIAWDTYSAVQFRYGSAGNADFIETLKDAKEKYKRRCAEK